VKKHRDFHISDDGTEEDLSPLLSDPPWRGPALRAEAIREADGAAVTLRIGGELAFSTIVQAFIERADVRAFAVAEMRCAAWWIRYSRFSREEAGMRAYGCFVEWRQVIEASGCPRGDVEALVGCLLHACTCDGCDLASGERMVRGGWLGGTGASSAP